MKSPAMQETWVQSLGWEDPLEKGMATYSSTFAWRIPWIESLVGCSPWGHKESDMTKRPTLLLLTLTSLKVIYFDRGSDGWMASLTQWT